VDTVTTAGKKPIRPSVMPADAQTRPEEATLRHVDQLRVLLVEDDEGDAYLVQELLAETGGSVAVSWVRTLAAAEQVLDVDCVLLDLGLPDAAGLDGLRRLLPQVGEGVAILVLTGYADEQQGMRAVAVGAQDYLVKGQVDGPLLVRAIRYAVERRRAEDAERALREERLRAAENTRLERGLLPTPLLTGSDIVFVPRYQPGGRRLLLGGDFYDAVQDAYNAVHVVIGDVSGHGPDEAALGVCLRIAWRTLVLAGRPMSEVLPILQQVLVHERHADHIFATMCALTITPDRRGARIYLAGHPAPLWLESDRVVPLSKVAAGLPLGMFEDAKWEGTQIELGTDWSLLLYTDGLIDVGFGADRLGAHGLVSLMNAQMRAHRQWRESPAVLLDALVEAVTRFGGGVELNDDLAVLLIGLRSSLTPHEDDKSAEART